MFETPTFGFDPEFRDRVSGDDVVDATSSRLVSMLGIQTCWFEAFPFDAQMPRIEDGRIELPAPEPGVASWSFGGGIELPVRLAGLTLGRFVLVPLVPTTGVALSPSDRSEARALAERVAPAIAAAMLNETAGGRAPR